MADSPTDKNVTEDGQFYLDGFEPLNQLKSALEIIRDMLPAFDDNDTNGLTKWAQLVRERMIAEGLSLDALAKITPPLKGTPATVEGGDIVLYAADNYKPPTNDDLIALAGYALLSYWILQGDENSPSNEEIAEILPQLKSVYVSKHTMPNNKLANAMQHGIIDGNPVDLVVSSRATRGKSAEITSYTIVSYEGENGLVNKSLTEYDRQVGDTLASLWLYGDPSHIITPEIVYRNMTQRTQSETPSPQQIGAVTRSLEKMRRVHIYVDATNEMRKRGAIGSNDTAIFDDFAISLRGVTVISSGKTIKAYQIKDEPILLAYSRMTNQLITTSADLLDIKRLDKNGRITTTSIANTENRIAVKGYLLRRIEVIRNDAAKTAEKQRKENARAKRAGETPKKIKPEQEPTILFDTLFTETGITKTDAKTDTRKYVFEVLDFYKAKGRIKAYKTRSKGRAISAVTIEL